MTKECAEILKKLKSLSDPKAVEGMARFGIKAEKVFGVSIPELRKIAKETGRNHALAQELWATGVHEARILASMVDDPAQITDEQMEAWVKEFDSWDVCDQCCMNLFDKTAAAYGKAVEWSGRKEEFVKRAGFALMAVLAVHDQQASDEKIASFLPAVVRGAGDERNFVRKAVNWALRQIGKRNAALNKRAIQTAKEIRKMQSKAAKWIAADALRELESKAVQGRLHDKKKA